MHGSWPGNGKEGKGRDGNNKCLEAARIQQEAARLRQQAAFCLNERESQREGIQAVAVHSDYIEFNLNLQVCKTTDLAQLQF